jgi:hypothetical protein
VSTERHQKDGMVTSPNKCLIFGVGDQTSFHRYSQGLGTDMVPHQKSHVRFGVNDQTMSTVIHRSLSTGMPKAKGVHKKSDAIDDLRYYRAMDSGDTLLRKVGRCRLTPGQNCLELALQTTMWWCKLNATIRVETAWT